MPRPSRAAYFREYRKRRRMDPEQEAHVREQTRRYNANHRAKPGVLQVLKEKRAVQHKRNRNVLNHLTVLEGGCAHCGNTDSRVLQWHHRDPTEKKFGIAHSLSRSWASMVTELAKCDVLCANCHLILHAEERDAK